jgi:hypothetical protein
MLGTAEYFTGVRYLKIWLHTRSVSMYATTTTEGATTLVLPLLQGS